MSEWIRERVDEMENKLGQFETGGDMKVDIRGYRFRRYYTTPNVCTIDTLYKNESEGFMAVGDRFTVDKVIDVQTRPVISIKLYLRDEMVYRIRFRYDWTKADGIIFE